MKIKNVLFALFMIIGANNLFAQELQDEPKVLFSKDDNQISVGGEIGFRLGGAYVDDRYVGEIGFELGVIRNHNFEAGLFAAGFFTESKYDSKLYDDYMFDAAYGGLYVQPIFFAMSPIHFSIPIRFGAGGISYSNERYWCDDDWCCNNFDDYTEDSGPLFVIEPGLQVEFNLFKHFHIGLGASYKFFGGLDLDYQKTKGSIVDSDGLNNLTYSLSFRFGKF